MASSKDYLEYVLDQLSSLNDISYTKPAVLVICDSTEKLNQAKTLISDDFKGVFVRDEAQAARYLEKHEVAFVIRDLAKDPEKQAKIEEET